MAEEHAQRRLAAILAADVVGYGRAHVEVAQVGEYGRAYLLSLIEAMHDLVKAYHCVQG